MQTLTNEQVAELLATAQGPVSYQSLYARTTALVQDGRWTAKLYARDYLNQLLEGERCTSVPVPAPTVSGVRSMPYAGPFPRRKHSHRCKGCELRGQRNAVRCYKSRCTKPQLTATCEWCRNSFQEVS